MNDIEKEISIKSLNDVITIGIDNNCDYKAYNIKENKFNGTKIFQLYKRKFHFILY